MRIGFQTLNAFSKFNIAKINHNQYINTATRPLANDTFERTAAPISLISFGRDGGATDFDVKKIHNIKCPVCNKITMDYKDIDEYVKNVANKKGQELVDAIDKYGEEYYWTGDAASKGRTVYRENVEGILEVIKRLAIENPNADLKGIVRIAAKTAMPDLVGKQLDVLSEIEAYALNNIKSKKERENLFNVTRRHRDIILGRVDNKHFKRKTCLGDIANVYITNNETKKEILEIVKKLPASTNDSSSFFVKYANDPKRGVKEIAQRFVYENKPTGEHVDCFSNGGVSDKENYFCDCAYCNSKRSDTPFKIWARTIPDFQERLQEYLDTVQLSIDRHDLDDDYNDYPKQIIKTIEKQSDGEIKLMDPKLHRKLKSDEVSRRVQEKKEQQRIEAEKEFKKLYQEFEETKAQMTESYSNSSRLKVKLNKTENKEEKQAIKSEIKKEEALQERLKGQIAGLKEQLRPYKNEFNF